MELIAKRLEERSALKRETADASPQMALDLPLDDAEGCLQCSI